MKTLFHKKSLMFVTLMVLLTLVGGSYYYYRVFAAAPASEETELLQTAKVRRGDLTVSASAAGATVPMQEIALGFRESGLLIALNVQPGDVVAAGQVLAQLDDIEAQAQVTQAEANLRLTQSKLADNAATIAQAEANLRLAQQKLEGIPTAIAQAEANLVLADLKMAALLAQPEPALLASAQANLTVAQADLAALLAGPTVETLTIAQAELKQATLAVEQAQAGYDKIAWADDVGASPQAAALQAATLVYEKAAATYQQQTAGATPDQIAAAEAKVALAQQQLTDLQDGPNPDEIAAAQLAVIQAEAGFQTARDTTTLEIAVEQAQATLAAVQDTTALEIAVEQAQLALAAAQRNLAAQTLPAPFSGTVLTVNAARGETVNTAPIINLANLSRTHLELFLDETDLDKLALDNEVEVEFDALPNQILTGQIVRINPTLVTVDGVPVVSAVAELNPVSDPGNGFSISLLPGMSAAVEIIAGRAEDALLVPVEALRELGPGQYAVFVMSDDQPTLRPVEVGLMDFTYAEVRSGLTLGEVVTTGVIATE